MESGVKERKMEKDRAIQMYKKMCEIRFFEERLYQLFLTEPMPGTIHQCNGQEAVYVGVCEALRKEDCIVGTHRGHGQAIAKGVSLKKMMAEIFTKETGLCKGMGGSMHLVDLSAGLLTCTGIVGAGVPIAAGAALAAKLKGTGQVIGCFFGDGAANRGAVHEGLNLAAIWKLPVVFVCENNLYGFSTRINRVMLLENVADRASAYGMPGVIVDGNDVLAVYTAACEAVQKARNGEGPTLLECKTYRHKGHSRSEPARYRAKEEVEEWMGKDPILRLKAQLVEMNMLRKAKVQKIEDEVRQAIEEAVTFALKSEFPSPDACLKYVFATGGSFNDRRFSTSRPVSRYRTSLDNQADDHEKEDNSR